jgi:hypothetical protein
MFQIVLASLLQMKDLRPRLALFLSKELHAMMMVSRVPPTTESVFMGIQLVLKFHNLVWRGLVVEGLQVLQLFHFLSLFLCDTTLVQTTFQADVSHL